MLVWIAVIGAVGAAIFKASGAEPTDAPQRLPFASQLARECELLLQGAVRRPYGIAWDVVPVTSPGGRSAPRHVALDPANTPAAGLVLLWSGELLNEPKFEQAAIDAARGISAATEGTGKIPLHAIFGASAAGRDEPSAVPDRAATRAGLAFLLAVVDSQHGKAEPITRATQRAAHWMLQQQTDDGGWPSPYTIKSTPRDQTIRILRLDNSDFRDSTYALLLAAATTDERQFALAAQRSAQKLISVRVGNRAMDDAATTQPTTDVATDQAPDVPPEQIAPLWSTAYELSGVIDAKLSEFQLCADVPASRYAMQTLLGAYLMNGEKPNGMALDSAAQAVTSLREADGGWRERYRLHPTTAPTTSELTGSIFHPPLHAPLTSTYGLEPTLQAVQQIKAVGRDRYLAMLDEQFTIRQQLAAATCGLMQSPLTLDFPVSRGEIAGYIKRHEADWKVLNGPVPNNTADQVRRLWALLIRAKLERQEQAG